MENKSSVSIIGSGNVASQLGGALYRAGHDIVQVVARNIADGTTLAAAVDAHHISDFAKMQKVDLVLIAVVDDIITIISDRIPDAVSSSAIIAHTSGSVSIESLSRHRRRAVIWPLQSIRQERALDWKKLPLIVSTSSDDVYEDIQIIMASVSDVIVSMLDQDRHKLHAPAVMVSNFTTFIYGLAAELCEDEKVDFNLLIPLISESADRLGDTEVPMNLLTGPAQRQDLSTIRRHKRSLLRYPDQLSLYSFITEMILSLSGKYNNYR